MGINDDTNTEGNVADPQPILRGISRLSSNSKGQADSLVTTVKRT